MKLSKAKKLNDFVIEKLPEFSKTDILSNSIQLLTGVTKLKYVVIKKIKKEHQQVFLDILDNLNYAENSLRDIVVTQVKDLEKVKEN